MSDDEVATERPVCAGHTDIGLRIDMQKNNKAASVHGKSPTEEGADDARRPFRAAIADLFKRSRQFVNTRFIVNIRDFLAERQPLVWLLALFIGVVVGYAALAFRWLIGIIQLPWLGTQTE